MKVEKYLFEANENFAAFEFVSEGKNGRVVKEVRFQEETSWEMYNLAMGDKNLITGIIDYLAVTDNGDTGKVLATVADIVAKFISHHPDAVVLAIGNMKARTRL